MTEAQILTRIGRRTDQLDELLAAGTITQEVYDAAFDDLVIWARQQRNLLARKQRL